MQLDAGPKNLTQDIELRSLNAADQLAISELLASSNLFYSTQSRGTLVPAGGENRFLLLYWMDGTEPRKTLLGLFCHKKLVAIGGIHLWREFPDFNLSGFIAKSSNIADLFLDELLKYVLRLGLLRGHFIYRAEPSFAFERELFYRCWNSNDYFLAEECFVPERSCPIFYSNWEIIGYQAYPFSIIIASWNLNPRVRIDQIQKNNTRDFKE